MDDETMGNIVSTEIPIVFTTKELQSAAKQLKNNKAPGSDGIPTEVL